jgi:16S rRNA (uracil1498-N3)-methyltransferase
VAAPVYGSAILSIAKGGDGGRPVHEQKVNFMSRRRFYSPPEDIGDSTITLSTDETHHLTHVLRLTPGNPAFVFDGCGREYKCTFSSITDNRAYLEITEALSDVVESPLRLTLAQALAKGEKFDLIIQKATELGVRRIVPLMTRYADVKLEEQLITRRLERWRRISLEALKQCGRRQLVEITTPRTLPQFLDDVTSADVAQSPGLPIEPGDETPGKPAPARLLLFSERGGVAIADALEGIPKSASIVALVGPEGGWSDDELDLLHQRGSNAVNLGPRVLRTETAAVVAITLIQHLTGDLSARVDE